MVGRTKDILFLAPLIEPKESPCHYVSTSYSGLVVAMSISGVQRILGRGFVDVEMASRFADMASLRFRRYRRQAKWNYSEAQAIADTENTEDDGGKLAHFHLARLQNEFRDSLEEYQAPPASDPAKLKANRRTVKSELLIVLSRLSALESGDSRFDLISTLEGRVAELENDFDDVLLKIASLQDEICLASQKVFLLEADNSRNRTPIIYPDAPHPTLICCDPISITPETTPSATPITIWKQPA